MLSAIFGGGGGGNVDKYTIIFREKSSLRNFIDSLNTLLASYMGGVYMIREVKDKSLEISFGGRSLTVGITGNEISMPTIIYDSASPAAKSAFKTAIAPHVVDSSFLKGGARRRLYRRSRKVHRKVPRRHRKTRRHR